MELNEQQEQKPKANCVEAEGPEMHCPPVLWSGSRTLVHALGAVHSLPLRGVAVDTVVRDDVLAELGEVDDVARHGVRDAAVVRGGVRAELGEVGVVGAALVALRWASRTPQ